MKFKIANFVEKCVLATRTELEVILEHTSDAHIALQNIEMGDIKKHKSVDAAQATYCFLKLLGYYPSKATINDKVREVQSIELWKDGVSVDSFGVVFTAKDDDGVVKYTRPVGLMFPDSFTTFYPEIQELRAIIAKAFPKVSVFKFGKGHVGNGRYETVWHYAVRSQFMQDKQALAPLAGGYANSVNEPVALMQAVVRMAHGTLLQIYSTRLLEENRQMTKLMNISTQYKFGPETFVKTVKTLKPEYGKLKTLGEIMGWPQKEAPDPAKVEAMLKNKYGRSLESLVKQMAEPAASVAESTAKYKDAFWEVAAEQRALYLKDLGDNLETRAAWSEMIGGLYRFLFGNEFKKSH